MSWEEQVRRSLQYDFLVGVHGNGLTNLMWLMPGACVFEIFPIGVHHYDYQMYCEFFGLDYFGLEGDKVFRDFGRSGPPYGHIKDANKSVEDLSWPLVDQIGASVEQRLRDHLAWTRVRRGAAMLNEIVGEVLDRGRAGERRVRVA